MPRTRRSCESARIGCTFLVVLFATNVRADGHAELRSQHLQLFVADNKAYSPHHRTGYNGVSELYCCGEPRNLFVPTYAGLNFEHIFNGDSATYSWNKFEPRQAPMKLTRRASNSIELLQTRTQNWPLETTLTYSSVEPDAVDLTVRVVSEENAWKKHGYIGLFFASYIQAPADKGISFIGKPTGGDSSPSARWIHHHSPHHGKRSAHRPSSSDWQPAFDPGFPLSLVTGRSQWKYDYPFYYGRRGEHVAIMMFKRPSKGGEIWFAQSPTGGGERNPAWDFILFQRDCEIGREFRFDIRLVVRPFRGREDVIQAYESWTGEKVTRPNP